MFELEVRPSFRKDLKRLIRKHFDVALVERAVDMLRRNTAMLSRYRDHALTGNLQGVRELHVDGRGDWLLMYIRTETSLILLRTGSHDDLFK
jgi:mRNA interferase YafQ